MKVSVNILTWNTLNTLTQALAVIKCDLFDIDHEVVIVDNGSVDGCKYYATIKNEKNLGISKGKNQGIDASLGEYIFMIDGDVIPVRNSIRLLVKYMDEHPDVMALGFHPNKWSNQRNKGTEKHHEEWCDQLVDVQESRGHCCYYGIYRGKIFDDGLRFDERYGPGYGYEDLDFFMEMKKRGIKQHVCHINNMAGKYFHDINSSIRSMGREEYIRSSAERAKMFAEKWDTANVG